MEVDGLRELIKISDTRKSSVCPALYPGKEIKLITSDKRDKVFLRDMFVCQVCGKHINRYSTPQLAHQIKSGKGSERHITAYIWNKYQKDRSGKWATDFIIDNELNLLSTCGLDCNSRCNIFNKPVQRDELIDRIIEETECLKYERMV